MSNILINILILFIIACGILAIIIALKDKRIQALSSSLNKLNKTFDTLDEQAKLIVKTDIELNKAQEELDKRLTALDALQKTSRLISTTLDESEIFHRLNQSLIIDLGFEKNLILTYDNDKKLQARVTLGFSEDDLGVVIANIEKDIELSKALNQGHTFSSASAPKQRKELLSRLLNINYFVISPILTQNGIIGIVFVGNHSDALAITEGDEELISILSNQIGQSIENARLFEQVFRSQQSLESKVQERTKQLESALEEVKNISKTKSEFISAVSHELRTPLTSIKGYAAILMAGKLGDVPDPVKERLGKINTHSDNLVKLINDLLDISRIESGRVEMKHEKCDIVKIIDNVKDLLTPQLKEKNIFWETELPTHVPEVLVDKTQIERVFINLSGNAIKFTPGGGIIKIGGKIENNQLSLEVSDNGIGISEDDIVHLFDEFYRVENTINQNVKGTGLGLALVKKIIEAHQGKIWVTSKLNDGTTFHFSLPLKTE